MPMSMRNNVVAMAGMVRLSAECFALMSKVICCGALEQAQICVQTECPQGEITRCMRCDRCECRRSVRAVRRDNAVKAGAFHASLVFVSKVRCICCDSRSHAPTHCSAPGTAASSCFSSIDYLPRRGCTMPYYASSWYCVYNAIVLGLPRLHLEARLDRSAVTLCWYLNY